MATNISNCNRFMGQRLCGYELIPERAPRRIALYTAAGLCLIIEGQPETEDDITPILETTLQGYVAEPRPVEEQIREIRNALENFQETIGQTLRRNEEAYARWYALTDKLDNLFSTVLEHPQGAQHPE